MPNSSSEDVAAMCSGYDQKVPGNSHNHGHFVDSLFRALTEYKLCEFSEFYAFLAFSEFYDTLLQEQLIVGLSS